MQSGECECLCVRLCAHGTAGLQVCSPVCHPHPLKENRAEARHSRCPTIKLHLYLCVSHHSHTHTHTKQYIEECWRSMIHEMGSKGSRRCESCGEEGSGMIDGEGHGVVQVVLQVGPEQRYRLRSWCRNENDCMCVKFAQKRRNTQKKGN